MHAGEKEILFRLLCWWNLGESQTIELTFNSNAYLCRSNTAVCINHSINKTPSSQSLFHFFLAGLKSLSWISNQLELDILLKNHINHPFEANSICAFKVGQLAESNSISVLPTSL